MSDQTFPIRRPGPSDSNVGEPTVLPTMMSAAPPALPDAPPAPPGFDILDELGRGGMGIVYRAHDRVMEREVAVKILRHADSAAADRFLDEARITGQLQHPGIPAVYQVGQLADGRPFLAMKLIRGDTLDQLLRAGDPVNVPAVFESICQAVGYAHAHGVIHRDLKPQNVMVGAFGEVQVMDWGLAKVLTSVPCVRPVIAPTFPAAVSPSSWVLSSRESDGSVTVAGSVLGTPAYMPPEQAAGDLEKIDPRSDVFGLGAVLCRMLTGKPPFDGASAEDVRQKAMRGETGDAFARLDQCGADPELVVLCMRCLAFNPADRPTDARELAFDVARLRAAADDRAKQAELNRATAVVQAAEQRKQRRQTIIAVSGLVAVLLVGVVGTSIGYFRAGKAEKETRDQLAQTEIAHDRARQRYDIALAAFDDMIHAIQYKLATRPGTLELRKELLTGARGGLKKLLAEAERDGNPDQKLVWSYYRMGSLETTLGNYAAAQQEYQTGHDLAKRLLDADPTNGTAQSDLSAGLAYLGDEAMRRKDIPRALEHYQAKFEIDRRLADANPTNVNRQRALHQSLSRLGEVSLEHGETQKALEFFEQKRQIVQRLVDADPKNPALLRDMAVAHELVGNAAFYLKRSELALDNYRKMHAIFQQMLDADPENVEKKRDLCISLGKLGNQYETAGQLTEAHGYYEQAVVVLHQLAAADPQNIKSQTELFIGYDNLGAIEEARHEYAAAAATYRKGRAIIAPLHERKLLIGQLKDALANVDRQIAACDQRAQREPAPPPRAGK